jgi:hypothetical protein
MNAKWIQAVALLALSLAAAAQDTCPRERAVSVPRAVDYGPAVTCPGLTYSMPGLTLTTVTGCPLFVTVTPAHEVIEASRDRTKVRVVGTDPVKIFFFTCQTRYLLFLPLSSYCTFDRESTIGTVMHLTTMECGT